jgi:hypothetical protein
MSTNYINPKKSFFISDAKLYMSSENIIRSFMVNDDKPIYANDLIIPKNLVLDYDHSWGYDDVVFKTSFNE